MLDNLLNNLLGKHFITFFVVILFSLLLGWQRSTRDRELRCFWLTAISCMLLIFQDGLEVMCSLDPRLRFWRTLLSVIGYVLRSTAALGLAMAAWKPQHRNSAALWIPWVINLLVCSTAFFSSIAFGFHEDNYRFFRGPLGFVPFAVPIYYLILILYLSFRDYTDDNRVRDRMILLTGAAFCLISAALDVFLDGSRLNDALVISSLFFYVFLRSYDIRRDYLTSVLNQKSLYDDCESLNGTIQAAASLDMNGLKNINARKGHQAGDNALKKIGECLRNVIGPDVRAYRMGGDEFVILFFRKDEALIRETLERIGESVRDAGYSISSGYAVREEGETPYDLIRRSDMRMFEQKARFYKDITHDRRRHPGADRLHLPEKTRREMEAMVQPFAIYRFEDHRIETLLVSDGFCGMFGFPGHDEAVHVLDHDMYRNIHRDDRERYSGAMLRFSDGKEELDVVYRTRSGMNQGFRVVHARGSHMHTATGDRVAYIWYMDEGKYVEGDGETGSLMTQALSRALHEESILHAAQYDELTRLPSLNWFFKLCEAKKTQKAEKDGKRVLLYLDLSGMKYFNDKYGFAEGDRLLKAFAELLSGTFGKENCCHVSADRFAACSMGGDTEQKTERLLEAAKGINAGKNLPVRVGMYAEDTEVSITTAFDRAKVACDSIRHSDMSCCKWYDRNLSDVIRKRQYVIANIDKAVQERWIRAYYQPIVSAADGNTVDEEALARWIDPVEGLLPPGDFVPYLEDTGLNYKLDLCILDQVIEKIRILQEKGGTVVPQSINLSRSDFETCDIVEEVRRRVDDAGIDHRMINIEITESIIGSDFDYINEQVRRFRKSGFAVWMDDFGSGYSSLDVLQSIHFDLIKFDMSFLRKLDEGENGKIILTELMKLAGQLHLDTVCEGVEKEDHVRFLQEIGCAKLQGYYFSAPKPWTPETQAAENK